VKGYDIIGSGAPYAKLFPKKCWNGQMTMEQVAELGYFIIKYIDNFGLNFTVGGEPVIWFIPDNERDEKGEKIDYVLKDRL
jgi:hypothetical protein